MIKDKSDDNTENKRRQDNHGILTGLILIFVGIILLLNTSGIIAWFVWDVILPFWPVILILSGIELLIGTTRIGAIAVATLTSVILLLVGMYALSSVHEGFDQWIHKRFPNFPRQNRIYHRRLFPPRLFPNDL